MLLAVREGGRDGRSALTRYLSFTEARLPFWARNRLNYEDREIIKPVLSFAQCMEDTFHLC